MGKNTENERATYEEVLIIYYASRNVNHKSIAEIMKLKYGHDHSEGEIMEKIVSIQKKAKADRRPALKHWDGKWKALAADDWMFQQVGNEQELRELIKLKPEVWEIIKKNGPTLALETSDLEENYLFGYWAVSGNEKN
ncbi:hypothetical protein MMC28_008460 [Mycoblastus sanguinarius]|nr:hypothetical protein [Mycoblastus sanguinarius]